ncbi:efflux RND transporter permease subunit [Beijerinckia mobilis]|uniref:efflux RND transporter permease subunit n=1 Tax=Beijerinckia mobilis TaxID=231434 RepID=UPI000A054C63|nr:efflux RND transporter permease subunit [Beijerinckia mobilis]
MNPSEVFIRRPIGTILLSIGLFLVGLLAYAHLPVASLPNVEVPTININASRPGADPVIMAESVAAPIERRIGEISGLTELTSVSALGSTNITAQFDLSRNIDGAARDVQAALNAAQTDLPSDLPNRPSFRKFNPAAAPVLILALTSDTIPASTIYDQTDTIVAQRIAQIEGVAQVTVTGADQPAIRVTVNPTQLSTMGLSSEDIRTTIVNANALSPTGGFDGLSTAQAIATNTQLPAAEDYGNLVVRNANGNSALLSSVAKIETSVRNTLSAAWLDGKPAVILVITKQAEANVIATVDRVLEALPEIQKWIPADIKISVLNDRTVTIRASVDDMQITMLITIGLVMLVIFVFLRRWEATLAAGITVPLALAGTCALMWTAKFSINNLSLMALTVAVGFVVDDAIVMIENIERNLHSGMSSMEAALAGSKEIGFTVISISISLMAAFIPLLLMGGILGRFFREFSLTLAFTILISTAVSLTLTPMICAYLLPPPQARRQRFFDRLFETAFARLTTAYAASLDKVLHHRALTLIVMTFTVAATVSLFISTPKGFFPEDDTGLLMGTTEAATDISFQAMSRLQQQVAAVVETDPAVASLAYTVGGSGGPGSSGGLNTGRLFISLKPFSESGVTANQVINRMRGKLAKVAGISTFLMPVQDLRMGGRVGKSSYQFTLWSPDNEELSHYVPIVLAKLRKVPGLVDVSTDREPNGLQLNVKVDRLAAARLGVSIQNIDNVLNNAFAQRQVSVLYSPRNQYRVILTVPPSQANSPADLASIYVPGSGGTQVPLLAVSHIEKSLAPLVTNHQGQFPAVTITYNLAPGATLQAANDAILAAVAELHLPDTLHAEFAGDAKALAATGKALGILVIAAFVAVYIVLGVLYESLAHPLTIISTLPSAGLGALLALQWTHMELSVIAFIGIILLIGIVKKNGIMLVDFALEGERKHGLDSMAAIREACIERFRPILMTTLAAFLGAIPLIFGAGPGSALRRPLGITIAGGLIVSQLLTLYTTPVIYLMLDRLHKRLSERRNKGDGDQRNRPISHLRGRQKTLSPAASLQQVTQDP